MFSLSRLRTLVVAILFLLPGAGAEAFFQTTTVEGTIGRDLGGIWLLVHHAAPQFRVRIDKDAAASRMQVGEISAETREKINKNRAIQIRRLLSAISVLSTAPEARDWVDGAADKTECYR